jgi:hypothetical protein
VLLAERQHRIAVRHQNEVRPGLRQPAIKVHLHLALGVRIEALAGLVQQEPGATCQQRAGERKPLAFAA